MSGTMRDHGGALDAAVGRFGGARDDWLDLSTGINPTPCPVGEIEDADWRALPDARAQSRLLTAARAFWNVPEGAGIIAAPGASSLIARLPYLQPAGVVEIATRTYNEHASAFKAAGWAVGGKHADARVVVHPNNPDGRLSGPDDIGENAAKLLIIDESFCDCCLAESHVAKAVERGVVILKSFGKFWGLAGVRLGFAIAQPETLAPLRDMLGPWPVSGPALRIGTRALQDTKWADDMREHLGHAAARLDGLMLTQGAEIVGGTPLFRLFDVPNAARLYSHLAEHHILTRIFPYSDTWLRLGLPADESGWQRLNVAMQGGV